MWVNGPRLDLRPGRKDVARRGGLGRDPAADLAEGLSIKKVSRQLGVARNSVRSAVRSDVAPVSDRSRIGLPPVRAAQLGRGMLTMTSFGGARSTSRTGLVSLLTSLTDLLSGVAYSA